MTEAATALECHDCGEVYPPGVSAAPCVGQGHYVGPVAACELPARPSHSRSGPRLPVAPHSRVDRPPRMKAHPHRHLPCPPPPSFSCVDTGTHAPSRIDRHRA